MIMDWDIAVRTLCILTIMFCLAMRRANKKEMRRWREREELKRRYQ